MDLKALKWQILRGTLMRRLLLKALFFTSAVLIVSIIHMAREARRVEPLMSNLDECPLSFGANSNPNYTQIINPVSALAFPLFRGHMVSCKDSKNVIKELMEKGLLELNAKALCVGYGSASAVLALRELGFSDPLSVDKHPFFSLLRRRFVYELGFEDNHFDFVLTRDLDRVSVPALLVLEIERILRPGAIGAMLVGSGNFYSGSLIRSATPVSSFLRSSDVVHVCGIGSYNLVIFKKRIGSVSTFFQHSQLPNECPSIAKNKPYMKHIEPLGNSELSYLPKFMNISSRDRLIYINVGVGDFSNLNISKLLELYYPIQPQAFNLFIVDHNTSALSSHVKKPGITFVYHPGLAGNDAANDEYMSTPIDEGDFDFVSWFNETVEDENFVVLRMSARAVELNILGELFKTGAICRVDELFLRCIDPLDCKGGSCVDCGSIFKSLRRRGVFVHQWTED